MNDIVCTKHSDECSIIMHKITVTYIDKNIITVNSCRLHSTLVTREYYNKGAKNVRVELIDEQE